MERTGHRSLTGVRSYKRTSDDQRAALFNIMNNPTKVTKIESRQKCGSGAEGGSIDRRISLSDSLQLTNPSFSGCTINFYVG